MHMLVRMVVNAYSKQLATTRCAFFSQDVFMLVVALYSNTGSSYNTVFLHAGMIILMPWQSEYWLNEQRKSC